jgi:ferritin
MSYIKSFNDFINESNKTNEGLEHEARLLKPVIDLLNAQIANELDSSQIYRSMSAWLDEEGWVDGSELFFKYADEELGHMSKIYKYLYEKNCRAVVPTCKPVPFEYKDIRALVEAALEHEIKVTADWTNIANIAQENNDHDTYTLAMSFVNEQREEEEKVRNILFKMDLDMPNWKIDELFGDLLGK